MGSEPFSAELEKRLVLAAQRGDTSALERLLVHFADPLFGGVILPRVGVRAEAEEILAETLEKAAMALDDFRYADATGIWPWLKRIALRRVIDHARRRKAAAGTIERYEAELLSVGPRVEPGAEAALIEAEERQARSAQLAGCLASILARYRRAIELRIYEERERDECARELGVTVGTFDVLLHRAIGALRKCFGDVEP